jgi:hypothetical protein
MLFSTGKSMIIVFENDVDLKFLGGRSFDARMPEM